MPLPYFLYLSCEILRQKIPLTKSKRCLVQNDRFKDPVQKEKQQKKATLSVEPKEKGQKKVHFQCRPRKDVCFITQHAIEYQSVMAWLLAMCYPSTGDYLR